MASSRGTPVEIRSSDTSYRRPIEVIGSTEMPPSSIRKGYQVVLAGLLDLAPLDVNIIHQELVLAGQLLQVEAEGADVLGQFLGGLLEGHEDAGLPELGGAADEELHGEQGSAAAGAAADERGPAARQAAAGDFIKPRDAGRGL